MVVNGHYQNGEPEQTPFPHIQSLAAYSFVASHAAADFTRHIFAGFPSVTSLRLIGLPSELDFQSITFEPFTHLPLQSLSLEHLNLKGKSFSLKGFKTLQTLRINACAIKCGSTKKANAIVHQAGEDLTHIRSLTSVELHNLTFHLTSIAAAFTFPEPYTPFLKGFFGIDSCAPRSRLSLLEIHDRLIGKDKLDKIEVLISEARARNLAPLITEVLLYDESYGDIDFKHQSFKRYEQQNFHKVYKNGKLARQGGSTLRSAVRHLKDCWKGAYWGRVHK